MESRGALNRHMQGLEIDPLDQYVNALAGNDADYAYAIADRNDYSIMLARTAIAAHGCRATRNRVMPA